MIYFNKSYVTANNYENIQNKRYTKNSLLIKKNKNHALLYQNKLLTKRTCKFQNNSIKFTETKAKNILQTISIAIEQSQLGTAIPTISDSILPNLSFANKQCFFKTCSESIQKLIVNYSLTLSEKFKVLETTHFLLKISYLSDMQFFYASNFILSIYTCLKISNDINNNIVSNDFFQIDKFIKEYNYLNNTDIKYANHPMYQQLVQFPLSIDLLFIEEEYRFIQKNNFSNEIIDLGAYAFDNEWLYMERCYRGFIYLLNQQITNKSKINFTNLRDVNAILGGYIVSNNDTVAYGCEIPKNYGNQFINLIKQGIICDANFKYSRDNLNNTERMFELEYFLYCSLGVNIKLKEIIFKKRQYFILISSKNQNKPSTTDIFEKQLLDDLNGITDNKAFIFSIIKKDNNIDKYRFYVQITYCYHLPRAEICQRLLDIYYKKIHCLSGIVQQVNLAVNICALIQRIHPFLDGNGRTSFFILFPVLLYQLDLWLIRMVKNPWLLLELDDSEKLTQQVLKLCTSAPNFKSKIDSWDKYITTSEKLRIHCALGNIEIIKNLLAKYPDLIHKPIVNDPVKYCFNILDFSVMNQQHKLFIFLFNKHPNKNNFTFEYLFYLMELSVEYNQIEILKYIVNHTNKIYGFSLPALINNKIFI